MKKDKSSQNIVYSSRYERDSFTSVFMQFTQDCKYFGSYAFCFYEGEDGKYYDSRIRRVFSDNIYTYKVNGKNNVLKLYSRLSDDPHYDNICCMYFIDKDFGIDSVEGEDIYQTPCYSIENLYVNEESLKRILQSEFGINPGDKESVKIIQNFKKRLNEFIDIIIEFNVYVYLRDKKRIPNSIFKAGDIKTNSIINIRFDGISKKDTYSTKMKDIRLKLNLENEEINKTCKEFNNMSNLSSFLRGKNMLDFFVEYIYEVKRCFRDNLFNREINGFKADIRSNRLSQLSQYAITPQCLEDFINEHYRKWEEMCHTI